MKIDRQPRLAGKCAGRADRRVASSRRVLWLRGIFSMEHPDFCGMVEAQDQQSGNGQSPVGCDRIRVPDAMLAGCIGRKKHKKWFTSQKY
jgi:hypothetical protein